MTRYARSGSTQKHKKMPGTATPWSEFSKRKANLPMKDKGQTNTIKTESDVTMQKQKSSFQQNVSPKKNKKKNKFAKKQNKEQDLHISMDEKKSSTQQNVSAKKKNFAKQNSKESNDGHAESVVVISGEKKVFEKKKSKYMEKLMKKRADKNIPLLPSKVERKLYHIKRSLRAKGLPTSTLIEIIRKERRKEEVKFRKAFNPSKPCYNCRKIGHILADCPEKSNSSGPSNLETGICFKCGSVDHTSYKCRNKVQGFPFAKCFICKEQGHISRDCPKNTRGVYIKGGRCNLCGNVNHLRKDCPSLKVKKKEEESITLHTIHDVTSVDEEIIEKKHAKKQNVTKSPKVVKF